MTNNKPLQFKEFWIYKISPGVTRVSDSKVTLDDEYFGPPDYDVPIFPTKVIHVVEYSAYDKAQQEIEALKTKLLEFEGMTFSENEEIAKLKAKCTRFEEALKFYANLKNWFIPNEYNTYGPAIVEDDCETIWNVVPNEYEFGGKRARQALEGK